MQKGDLITIDISSMGMSGEGVGRVDGFVVFVDGALQGERVKAQVIQVKKSFCNAKVIKVLVPSNDRVEPKCNICFKCGGCEMQHIRYAKQLEIKKQRVKDCLERECKMTFDVDDTIASPQIFNYRNKIQLPISRINNELVGGYFAPNSHKVIPFCKQGESGVCHLNCEGMLDIVDVFLDYMQKEKISPYDETTHSGSVRHLVIRKVGDKYAICVVVNGQTLKSSSVLIDMLKEKDLDFSLYVSPNTNRTNVIMGDNVKVLYGEESLQGEALGVKFKVSPQSFMQVNDSVRDMIYSKVGEIIKSSGISNVIDAYSGVGIMSNIFAKFADKVYAIEIVPQAIENSKVLAKLNGNEDKIINICGDCAKELPKVVESLKGDGSIVVLDPPRKGCDIRVIDALLLAKPNKIIYVSCNPATLARDVKLLLLEYSVEFVTPYDMFPQTKHIETLVVLSKKNSDSHIHIDVEFGEGEGNFC